MPDQPEDRERPLEGREKRVLTLLGLPTFALALAITGVTTYVPLLAKRFTGSTTVIGVVIGLEGAIALFVPLAAGAWSDQLRTRIGGRLPFLVVGAPVIGVSVALMGFAGSLLPLAALVALFFIAYYVAYEPYRALYPDLLDNDVAGRGQSVQAVFRGAGTGFALIGGGLLFSLSPRVPFIASAVLAVAAISWFVWRVWGDAKDRDNDEQHEARTSRQTMKRTMELLRERPALRAFLVANALWELSLAALKTFIVLFLTTGMGLKMTESVGVIAVVAVLILAAAPVSGKLGDRLGKTRVVSVSLWVYGLGLLVPLITQNAWIVAPVLPFIAFGGGMILTLPYAILMPLMPEEEHGLLTGFYSFSRGIGILLGPLIAGVAISVLRGPLSSTHGYAAMWGVCAVAILASIPLMPRLRDKEASKRRQRGRSAWSTA
jgi:MFS family permease